MDTSSPPASRPTIEATRPDDLPALGRFLAQGFHAPPDAEFAAPDVLGWKYLEPIGGPGPGATGPRSFVARDAAGAIVGHVGLAWTRWRLAGAAADVPLMHLLDWLVTPEHRGLGSRLMQRAHAAAPVQYVVGARGAARRVSARAGYDRAPPVPVFRRVLRARRPAAGSGLRGVARAVRDATRLLTHRTARPPVAVTLTAVDRFGTEAERVVARAPAGLAFTGRDPEALNALLRYPRGGPRGYRVEAAGAPVGVAVLNVVAAPGGGRSGKVVDLFLVAEDPALWQGAFGAAAAELRRLGADVALACGSTPWEATALPRAGFRPAYELPLFVRDRDGRLPRDAARAWHLGFLEADYAVLP